LTSPPRTTSSLFPYTTLFRSMLSPQLLLLDEPLGALDPLVRAALQKDLKEIFARLRKTVLFVTHDLAEAIYFGDEIVLMNEGRIDRKSTRLNSSHQIISYAVF